MPSRTREEEGKERPELWILYHIWEEKERKKEMGRKLVPLISCHSLSLSLSFSKFTSRRSFILLMVSFMATSDLSLSLQVLRSHTALALAHFFNSSSSSSSPGRWHNGSNQLVLFFFFFFSLPLQCIRSRTICLRVKRRTSGKIGEWASPFPLFVSSHPFDSSGPQVYTWLIRARTLIHTYVH